MLVNAPGQIEAQSGGFEVKAGLRLSSATRRRHEPAGAIRNVYIDANEPLDDNGIVATIALQNVVDQSTPPDAITNGTVPGADSQPGVLRRDHRRPGARSPASSAARRPTTNDVNHFVVSPRLSDGQLTDNTNRKRFYVVITGDSSDYVAP